jgi:hypothetical protein
LAESKRLLFFFDKCSDDVQSELSLTNAVLGFTSRFFLRIANQIDLFSRRMATFCHGPLSFRRNFSVDISNEFTGDSFVFDMGIPIGKAPPLLSRLIRGHFNFARSFNEFFELFCHFVSPDSRYST